MLPNFSGKVGGMMKDKGSNITNKGVREILRNEAEAYQKASRKAKGKILDNLEAVLKRDRKSLIRSLNNINNEKYRKKSKIKTKPRGRPRIYTKEVEAGLEELWEVINHPCAERLRPVVPDTIAKLQKKRKWHYSEASTKLILDMPVATMRFYLTRISKDKGLMRGISTTRSSQLLSQVPIFHGDWNNKPLGSCEIDTVVHSGPRLEGIMAYTVSSIEMQTYWQAYYAQLGKTAEITRDSISRLAREMPVRLRGIHSDSGDEFVNKCLIDWCKKRGIEFTRSRPYKKNDNANVEERNRSVVRKYIGFNRYDCIEVVAVLNELYKVLGLYVNFFQPIMKVAEKQYLPDGHQIRHYNEAKTPYLRILENPYTPEKVKQKLNKIYDDLYPDELLAKIKALTIKLDQTQRKLGYHFSLPDIAEDIRNMVMN